MTVQVEESDEEAAPAETKEARAARKKAEQKALMQQRASELLEFAEGGQQAAAAGGQEKGPGNGGSREQHPPRARPGDSGSLPRRIASRAPLLGPEGDLHRHRYGKVPAKARSFPDTLPIPEESPPSPSRSKKFRGTSPPEERPRSKPRVARQVYLPPHSV